MSPNFILLFLLLFVTDSLAKEKISHSKTKIAHKLKKSKPHHKAAQRKGSMVFEETSKENVKSRLDKSFGLLGPWNQNPAETLPGCMGQQRLQRLHQGLLNEPINPIMRINGYPINPKGAKSLAQTIDGNLEEEEDLHEVIAQMDGRKAGYKGHGMGGVQGEWRPLRPQINYPMHRFSPMGGGRMLGGINANDGYRREKTIHPGKKDDIFNNLHSLILKKMYAKRLAKLRSRRLRLRKLQEKRLRLLKLINSEDQADRVKLMNC